MAKLRSVSTAFWSDPFIEDLTPNEKLLFLYLVTNEKTNMLGIYESSIKKIAFETGLKKEEVQKALKGFERVKKVKYKNNFVILVNFMKHQNFNTNMKKSAIDIYNNLPKELKDSTITVCKSNPSKGFEILLKCFGMVPKDEDEDEDKDKDKDKEYKIKKIEDRELEFINSTSIIKNSFNKSLVLEFISYWTEKNPNGLKMKFEMQKTFDIKRRFNQWEKNNKKWNEQSNSNFNKQSSDKKTSRADALANWGRSQSSN